MTTLKNLQKWCNSHEKSPHFDEFLLELLLHSLKKSLPFGFTLQAKDPRSNLKYLSNTQFFTWKAQTSKAQSEINTSDLAQWITDLTNNSPQNIIQSKLNVLEICANIADKILEISITPKIESPPKPDKIQKAFRDLRGTPCPINSAKVILELSRLEQGQHLEVLLDSGSPIENVPQVVVAEGHKILTRTPQENWWVLLIEKQC